MTPRPRFEFCAFRFLSQWQEDESALHSVISATPTKDSIRKALSYFQVARNFKGLKNDENASFILESLLEVRNNPALLSPDEKVIALVQKLKTRFNRSNVSAASKLLWLSKREPFIIYDTRAVTALTRDLGHKLVEWSYSEYSNAWRKEYAKHEALIENAVEELPKARPFMRVPPASDEELLRMAKETWFMERVFDMFLWEVGVRD